MASHDKVLVLAGDKETGEWSIVGTFDEDSTTIQDLMYEMESSEDPSARIVIATSDFMQF